jgi:hypothetical protein
MLAFVGDSNLAQRRSLWQPVAGRNLRPVQAALADTMRAHCRSALELVRGLRLGAVVVAGRCDATAVEGHIRHSTDGM